VRILIRTITAEQYDEAAAACPECCPLIALGDCRTGQQLLQDAPLDFAISLRCFFRNNPARETDFLRHLAETSCPFEPGGSLLNCALESESAPAAIEQPIPLPAQMSIVDSNDSPSLEVESISGMPEKLISNADWALSLPLRRFWSFGCRAKDLVAMFNAVPPALRALLCRAAAAAQRLEHLRQHPLQHVAAIVAAQAVAAPPVPDSVFASVERASFCDSAAEGADVNVRLWENEGQLGFLTLRYDGATQRRQSVWTNAVFAAMYGKHREELSARFAANDIELPLTELDYMTLLAHELWTGNFARQSRYLRVGFWGPGEGNERRGALIHMITSRYFDGMGRVTRVS
jgi:hypothetical protein